VARHLLFGAVIDDTNPLSMLQVSGGAPGVRHMISGAVIDNDHPLSVSVVGGGGTSDYNALSNKPDLTVYELLSHKGAASGYASLDAGALVPVAQLGTGAAPSTKYLRGDQTWQTLPTPDLTPYLLLAGGTMVGNLQAPTLSIGGAPLTGPLLSIPVAPTASANYGLLSFGSGPFDGVTSGFFTGNALGTHLAINATAAYGGRVADWQVGGVRLFAVGRGTIASGASATLNAIDMAPFTVSVTGNTPITTAGGFNYNRIGIPTYSAASALAITNAATLAIEGAPLGAGAGPATITNAYALWVQGGATRFDGRLIETANGAASTPALLLSGTPYTAGNGTTNKPLLMVEPTGTTSTGWSTAGTMLGVNAPASPGYTGNIFDFQAAGVSKLKGTAARVTAAVPLTLPAGTAAAPSLNFGSVTDSGFCVGGNSQEIDVITGGVARLRFSSTQDVRIINRLQLGPLTMGDITFTRLAAGSLQLGESRAVPVEYILTLGDTSRAGTDSDTQGAGGTIRPGLGTGTGTPQPFLLQCTVKVASGTSAQAYANVVRAQGVNAAAGLAFFTAPAVIQQTVDANINNVASSGTTGQFDDFTNGSVYATDYAALHATIYQLTRSVTQITTVLRNYGLGV
jgi:hypothetical protein